MLPEKSVGTPGLQAWGAVRTELAIQLRPMDDLAILVKPIRKADLLERAQSLMGI